MKAKIDFDYWNTLYEYLIKDDTFKLNRDIVHDAKVIVRVKELWKCASKKYLKNISTESIANVWCNVDKVAESTDYYISYNAFIDYLFYATDRMSPNRWLSLQLFIARASDMVYIDYCDRHTWTEWGNDVCGGHGKHLMHKIEENCEKEWKEKILPLIKQKQLEKENEN